MRAPSLAAWTAGALLAAAPTHAKDACSGQAVDVGSHRLWTALQGTGGTTVVFEAGGGADSSVWAALVPQVQALGVKTLVYDRAGLGRSDPRPGPYGVERDARDLRTLLDRCGVTGRVLVVSHSYGGFVSLLTAADDRRVAGLVLVDANVPGYFTPARLDALLAEYRPRYAELREKAPQLAAVMIPMMEAYPASARAVEGARLPEGLPIVDIVAERSWATTPADAQGMREAHDAFVRGSAARSAVLATGSSHDVMRDRPELIVDAVKRLVARD
ncbi:MAG: alpha/beta fold hydrolase [Vicinamibacteria bacterium]